VVGLHSEIFQVMSREERMVQTEYFFRGVNEVIARTGGSNGSTFLCECANPHCNDTFDMTAHDLRTLHSVPGDYVVMPGHDIPDLEEVVRQQNGYAIVRNARPHR
jgi:hypothetical protein